VRELRPADRLVAECYADPLELDRLDVGGEGAALRVAPDQMILLGEPSGGDLVAAARRWLGSDAIVEDVTDGWAAWVLEGDDVRLAFSFLSRLELPEEGFVQGEVARVPVKVLASAGRLELLVPSMWREHLRDRILRRCAPVVEVRT
jgi:hypothetical protein